MAFYSRCRRSSTPMSDKSTDPYVDREASSGSEVAQRSI
jgi:hypothetical protein